jgi:hypothetical protein
MNDAAIRSFKTLENYTLLRVFGRICRPLDVYGETLAKPY